MTDNEYIKLQNELITYNAYMSGGLKRKIKGLINQKDEKVIKEYRAMFETRGIYDASNGQGLQFIAKMKNMGLLKEQTKKEIAKKIIRKVVRR